MIARFAISQPRRLIATAANRLDSAIMSEGISRHLVLPKGGGFGVKDGLLDKSAFLKALPVLAAKVDPAKTGVLLKAPALKRYVMLCISIRRIQRMDGCRGLPRSLIDVPKVKSVVRGPNQERLVLLKYSDQGAYISSSSFHGLLLNNAAS